jgi:hypothetical protein
VSAFPGGTWCPARIYRSAGVWLVDWIDLGPNLFTDPFFDITLRACMRRPFNLAIRPQTRLDELPELDPEAVPPSGFIFHLSRCGSTLITRVFGANPATIALSEPGPVDDVLRASRFDPGVSDAWRISRLRAVVSALGRRRHPGQRNLVIKLDAWHAFDLELVERAFPGVPWFFVYRDPVEVMVSQERAFSWFMSLINSSLLDLSVVEAAQVPPQEYRARILARICEAVLAHGAGPDRLVSYEEFPDVLEHRIAPAFGLPFGDAERTALVEDAKSPGRRFVPDTDGKRADVSEEIRAATERFIAEPYARLEAIRTNAQDKRSTSWVTLG